MYRALVFSGQKFIIIISLKINWVYNEQSPKVLTVVSLGESGRPLKTQCIVNILMNFKSPQGVRERFQYNNTYNTSVEILLWIISSNKTFKSSKTLKLYQM